MAPPAFSWHRQWYPALPLSYLPPSEPTAVQILGERLVVWRAEEGWSCFEDACPHRLAPLSTAKCSSKGTLTCRYHGWTFDRTGRCVHLPMAESGEAQQRASREARPRAFPVCEAGGLLWVWLDASEEGWEESCRVTPSADDGLSQAEWTFQLQPVSYEALVENALDPSHAPFLHEGLAGQGMEVQSPNNAVPMLDYSLEGEARHLASRSSSLHPLHFLTLLTVHYLHSLYLLPLHPLHFPQSPAQPLSPISTPSSSPAQRLSPPFHSPLKVKSDGFAMVHSGYTRRGASSTTSRRFEAPASIEASVALPKPLPPFTARLYFVPSAPGETRVIFHFPNYEPTPPRWAGRLPERVFRVWGDVLHAAHCVGDVGYWRFNDQDRVAMQGQDRTPHVRGERGGHAVKQPEEGVQAKASQATKVWLRFTLGCLSLGEDPLKESEASLHHPRGRGALQTLPAGVFIAAIVDQALPLFTPTIFKCISLLPLTTIPLYCPRCQRSLSLAVAAGNTAARASVASLTSGLLLLCLRKIQAGALLACIAVALRWLSSYFRKVEGLFFRDGTDAERARARLYTAS
ncbi:MAG: hypothetical protein SGPRY_003175 [Prymnesium sp.]